LPESSRNIAQQGLLGEPFESRVRQACRTKHAAAFLVAFADGIRPRYIAWHDPQRRLECNITLAGHAATDAAHRRSPSTGKPLNVHAIPAIP